MITIDNIQFEPFIREAELKKCVAELARQISRDYEGRVPLLVAILNGAFIFAADLVREITIEHEILFARVASYCGTEQTGQVKKLIGLPENVKGRDVVLIEDIVDTGVTMEYMLEDVKSQGAGSVEVCSLLQKPSKLIKDIHVKYLGMEIPDNFVLGYGLDYNQKGRNFKDLYKAL